MSKSQTERVFDLPAPSEVRNPSGLRPLGHAVLVEPYEPEIKKSMIVIPETVQERTKMLETRATVIEVGPTAWRDEPARAKPGDRVLIARMSGSMVTGVKDGKLYRMVNANDIYCGIEE